jgi:hypothetical protein
MAKKEKMTTQDIEKEGQAAEEAKERRAALLAAITPLQATLILARRGNLECLPQLRKVLDEHPELWQGVGDLTRHAQESWLTLLADKNLHIAESMRRHLASMRSELAGAGASPLDHLLIDRILACYVQVSYFDIHEGQNPSGQNIKFDKYRMHRQDQAHRQFLSAVKQLATVRQLAAKTIQIEWVNPPTTPPSKAPIVPDAHGECQPTVDTPADGFNLDIAKSGNRVARFHGHNRISDRLAPVGPARASNSPNASDIAGDLIPGGIGDDKKTGRALL